MARLAPRNTPPPWPPSATSPLPATPAGPQLLTYTPNGPLGGTFTCTRCGAQAWQPDLLNHTPDCAYRSPAVTLR